MRVSTKDQEHMYWMDLQKTAIKNHINSKPDLECNWNEHVYEDWAVSWATEIDERPWLSQLFNDVKFSKTKPFDIVIVYKIDRFARKLSILLDIVDELKNCGIDFISTQEYIDTTTPFGKAMLGIMWVFAELDREMIQEKMASWKQEAMAQWVWSQSVVYGYKQDKKTKKVEIVKEQAEIVQIIFDMLLNQGKTVTEIRNYLNKAKIQIPWTYSSKHIAKDVYKWNDKTIRIILQNERYTWVFYYDKTKTIKDKDNKKQIITLPKSEWKKSEVTHIPIIDKETFERVQEIMEEKKWFNKRTDDYMLSGLLKCNHCQMVYERKKPLAWTGTKTWGVGVYNCTGKNVQKYKDTVCHTIPLPKEEFELIIVNELKMLIKNPQAIVSQFNGDVPMQKIKKMIMNKIEQANNEITRIDNKINNLDQLYHDGWWNLTREELKDKMSKLSKNKEEKYVLIKSLETQMDDAFDTTKQIKAFEYLRDSISNIDEIFADKERCYTIIHTLIDKIIIYSEPDENIKLWWRRKSSGQQIIPKAAIIYYYLPQNFFNNMMNILNPLRDPTLDILPSGIYGNKEKIVWRDENKKNDAWVTLSHTTFPSFLINNMRYKSTTWVVFFCLMNITYISYADFKQFCLDNLETVKQNR
jgi:site-specific DNA recombinase